MSRQNEPPEDSAFIRKAFINADICMNTDQYDSAQFWLNKIHDKISYRKPSLFAYFLTTRQAEVYYYNNLHQLGLQEAQRAVTMSEVLRDSILRADAYNFCGLFYTNIGKVREAIPYFKKGIALSKQPPYPAKYIDLSQPHHLYGNLSEAFEKINAYDSAIYYGRQSLIAARKTQHKRGIASACLNLGFSFLNKKAIDSAQYYFEQSRLAANRSGDFDVEINSYGSLAICASLKEHRDQATGLLDKGFALIEGNPLVNRFYALQFLEQAAKVYKKYGDYRRLAATLEQQSQIQTTMHQKNNQQYLTILMNGLKNETRILNMEIAEARHEKELATTRLYVGALILLLLVAGFISYRYYVLQRLRVADLRDKISQDLHDDVGGTLSGIALYAYIAQQHNNRNEYDKVTEAVDVISKYAIDTVGRLTDIVWAVNPMHDSMESLVQRLELYAREIATTKKIQILTHKSNQLEFVKLPMEHRKNIYLLCKEAVNNAVKYSEARHIMIGAAVESGYFRLAVVDNGIGFDIDKKTQGSGMNNMKNRAAEMGATLKIFTEHNVGTRIILKCKITQ